MQIRRAALLVRRGARLARLDKSCALASVEGRSAVLAGVDGVVAATAVEDPGFVARPVGGGELGDAFAKLVVGIFGKPRLVSLRESVSPFFGLQGEKNGNRKNLCETNLKDLQLNASSRDAR